MEFTRSPTRRVLFHSRVSQKDVRAVFHFVREASIALIEFFKPNLSLWQIKTSSRTQTQKEAAAFNLPFRCITCTLRTCLCVLMKKLDPSQSLVRSQCEQNVKYVIPILVQTSECWLKFIQLLVSLTCFPCAMRLCEASFSKDNFWWSWLLPHYSYI